MSIWSEKYRPQTLDDCILPKSAESLRQLVGKGEIPNLLFHGSAGVGKTTAAKAICKQLGYDYILVNASSESGIDVIRTTIKSFASSMSVDGRKKAIILDEADGTTQQFQWALRGVTEEVHSNCVFILTCNYKNKLIEAIRSRCSDYEFNIPKSEKKAVITKIFKRASYILKEEGITVESKEAVGAVIVKKFPDIRKVINELQKHSSSGVIDLSVIDKINSVKIEELVKFVKEKNLRDTRQWLADHMDEPTALINDIYKECKDYVEPASIPELILILNEAQKSLPFVANTELHIVAMLVEMMMGTKFK